MINNSEFQIYDGDYEIVFSNTFNLYEDKLSVKPIRWYEVEFIFLKDSNQNGSLVNFESDSNSNKIKVLLTNFNNSLGTWTTKKISLMTFWEWNDKKEIFFSLFGSSLNESTTFLQVTLTLYVK